MKRKLIAFVCLLLAFVIGASACNVNDDVRNTDKTSDTEATQGTETTQSTESSTGTEKNDGAKVEQCTSPNNHNYVEVSKVDALALKDGEIKYECSHCKSEIYEKIPATKSLKILALGNSFTDDSTWHLWNICKDAGVEDLIVANMYVGDCTLDRHWNYILNEQKPYIYRKTVSGTRVNTSNYGFIDALTDEDWDFIVLHQTSGSSGQAGTFTKLDSIIEVINSEKTNPDAKIIWHMPWAYEGDSKHTEFSKYDNDQMKMYETIVSRVKEIILPKDTIFDIIPSGTSIQNLRTSYVNDNVTRDGYHLDEGFGRYTAGLTWYAILTGGDVNAPDWVPDGYQDVTMYLPAIREAVSGALKNNFEVTKSHLNTPEEGFDFSNYELLEWDYITNAYWNCKDAINITHPASTDTVLYNTNICVDQKYSIEDLPVGTIFVCDYTWRFRLEQYPTEDTKYTGSRHGGHVDTYFLLTESFLNGCNYVAWSVSTDPRSVIAEKFDEAYTHVRIYIPKS